MDRIQEKRPGSQKKAFESNYLFFSGAENMCNELGHDAIRGIWRLCKDPPDVRCTQARVTVETR